MSTKDDDALLYSILSLAIMLPFAAWSGFVLTHLWTWFVVPLGVPAIDVWQAAGLFLITSWMAGAHQSSSSPKRDQSERDEFIGRVSLGALLPLFIWGIGAIYHAFM